VVSPESVKIFNEILNQTGRQPTRVLAPH